MSDQNKITVTLKKGINIEFPIEYDQSNKIYNIL